MSIGGPHLLRVVGGLNESNGGWQHIVVNVGCGMDDGFCGGNPLQVADRLNNVDWHGV